MKFFGTAPGSAADYEHVLDYFDQITPENAGKWASVEPERDVMNWNELDVAYAFARENELKFKFHTLVWGQQQPSWLAELPPDEQLAEIDEWMAAIAERYPDLEMIDVVNEPLHAKPDYSEALGGAGESGWAWMIAAFEMARAHFPRSRLILNDYNVLILENFTNDYLSLVRLLEERGLLDGIGVQGHFLERAELDVVAANLDRLAETGLPIYVSELDVNFADDARHATRLRDLFTLFWGHPSVAGVTHWGHLQGDIWRTDAYLVRSDGSLRPGLEWLLCHRAGRDDCTVPDYTPSGWRGGEYGLTLEAEEYDDGHGLAALGNTVAYTDDGDWIGFAGVEFQAGWDTLWVTYAKGNTDAAGISIHLDDLDAEPILTVALPPTPGWGSAVTLELSWSPVLGTHDVYVRFNGGPGVANLDGVRFGKPPPDTGPNLVANGDFESGTTGWSSWVGAVLSASTAQAYSGSRSLLASNRTSAGQFAVYNLTGVVSANTAYRVSAQVFITGESIDTVRLAGKVGCASGDGYPWLHNDAGVVPGEWRQMSGNLVIPADCGVTDVAIFFEGTSAGVDVYIDDVSVIPLPS